LVVAGLYTCFFLGACSPAADTPSVEGGSAPSLEGTAAPAARGLPSVVTLMPDTPTDVVPTEAPVVDQYALRFYPDLLVVRVGQEVEFRNSEDVVHNVRVKYVESDSVLFNVVTPPGQPYRHTFQEPGEYEVTCDIHVGMLSFILVTRAPYAVTAAEDGRYVFPEVPPGRYTRTVWSADPGLQSVDTVEIEAGGS